MREMTKAESLAQGLELGYHHCIAPAAKELRALDALARDSIGILHRIKNTQYASLPLSLQDAIDDTLSRAKKQGITVAK